MARGAEPLGAPRRPKRLVLHVFRRPRTTITPNANGRSPGPCVIRGGVCSSLASACYPLLRCVAVLIGLAERRAVAGHRHGASVARGGDGTAHRARDPRERAHV